MSIEFPPRPNENSDPWYEAREAYDEAIESRVKKSFGTRGRLPAETDLNDVQGESWLGSWGLSSANTYYNLPEPLGESPNSVVVFELVRGMGESSYLQRITVGGLPHIGAVGVYWRESGIGGEWFPWYKHVSTTDLDSAPERSFSPSRGRLPAETDLNDVQGESWLGVWGLSSANTYYNLPEPLGESPNSVVVFELVRGLGASSHLQRITVGGFSHIGAVGVYWRESGIGGEWFPWYKHVSTTDLDAPPERNVISSNEVQSIRVTTDPEESSGRNELLIVVE